MADRQEKIDELLGRALRHDAFRERLTKAPDEVAKEMGLQPEELELFSAALHIGGILSPGAGVAYCTAKTCNEKGGARMPDQFFRSGGQPG